MPPTRQKMIKMSKISQNSKNRDFDFLTIGKCFFVDFEKTFFSIFSGSVALAEGLFNEMLLTFVFSKCLLCLFLEASAHLVGAGSFKSQPIGHPQTHTKKQKKQKHKNVHEMGRRGSKINIRHGVMQRFSRLSSSWPAFGPKPSFLTSYEKLYFLCFLFFVWV